MKLIVTRDTYVCGEPVKAGDVVNVEEPHAGHMLSAGCARRATAADEAPSPAAPVIETAEASTAPEKAVTRRTRNAL
jgi:hypothetical protein